MYTIWFLIKSCVKFCFKKQTKIKWKGLLYDGTRVRKIMMDFSEMVVSTLLLWRSKCRNEVGPLTLIKIENWYVLYCYLHWKLDFFSQMNIVLFKRLIYGSSEVLRSYAKLCVIWKDVSILWGNPRCAHECLEPATTGEEMKWVSIYKPQLFLPY